MAHGVDGDRGRVAARTLWWNGRLLDFGGAGPSCQGGTLTEGLRECHIVEVSGGDEAIPHELGAAAARYFGESTLWGSRVGFTSSSSTLREMARRLDPVRRPGTTHVIETLGYLGPPPLQHQAGRATLQLTQALAAEPVLLRTPGVIADPALRQAVLRNRTSPGP